MAMGIRTISGCALLFPMKQTIMIFYIIVVSVFIVTLHGRICNAQPPYSCDSRVNYTEGSKFESNLNTVFNNLVQGKFHSGFNTCVHGQRPDQIYGLLQCNGDATTQQCSSCSQNATTTIKQLCGNAIGGKIWLEVCYLRYENGNFFGQLDNSGRYSYNPEIIPSSHVRDAFDAALQRLFNNLSGEAISGSGYASGTTADSLSLKIYGLVQCRRDMSIHNCTLCLSSTIHIMITNFGGRRGGEGLTGSCRVRYETYRFFHPTTPPTSPAEAPANPITNSPPKQNTPAEAPANPITNSPPKQNTPAEAPANPIMNSPPKQNTPAEAPANSRLRQITPCSGSTQIKQYSKASNKMPIILGAAGVLLLLLVVCLFSCWRRFQCVIFRRPHEGHWQVEEDTLSEDRQIIYNLETLVAATNNFHDDNKLGEGGFGPVYKGTTEDGKEIAVKKLSLESAQGKKEFVNEVNLVAKIQHRNLVKLLGCCTEGSERLLVYEYLPNKSLDKFLFNADKRKELDWKKRYNIILGVARGLLYLHQDSRLRIVHRDIKASNLLLDEKLNPKITDFGLARLFPDDETHLSTGAAGTLGYMAPEYALGGQLSVKADVYSFGVVLLELMTGRKNTDYNLPSDMEMLLGWAWSSFKGGNIVQTIDPTIIETWDEEQALRCVHVGLLCTQADSSLRPTMSTVSLMLSTLSVTLPAPAKPAYVTSGLSDASSVSSSQFPLTALSNADASITILVPR